MQTLKGRRIAISHSETPQVWAPCSRTKQVLLQPIGIHWKEFTQAWPNIRHCSSKTMDGEAPAVQTIETSTITQDRIIGRQTGTCETPWQPLIWIKGLMDTEAVRQAGCTPPQPRIETISTTSEHHMVECSNNRWVMTLTWLRLNTMISRQVWGTRTLIYTTSFKTSSN